MKIIETSHGIRALSLDADNKPLHHGHFTVDVKGHRFALPCLTSNPIAPAPGAAPYTSRLWQFAIDENRTQIVRYAVWRRKTEDERAHASQSVSRTSPCRGSRKFRRRMLLPREAQGEVVSARRGGASVKTRCRRGERPPPDAQGIPGSDRRTIAGWIFRRALCSFLSRPTDAPCEERHRRGASHDDERPPVREGRHYYRGRSRDRLCDGRLFAREGARARTDRSRCGGPRARAASSLLSNSRERQFIGAQADIADTSHDRASDRSCWRPRSAGSTSLSTMPPLAPSGRLPMRRQRAGQKVLQTNVTGFAMCSRAALPYLRRSGMRQHRQCRFDLRHRRPRVIWANTTPARPQCWH